MGKLGKSFPLNNTKVSNEIESAGGGKVDFGNTSFPAPLAKISNEISKIEGGSVVTETFTGTFDNPFGGDTSVEKIAEIATLLKEKRADVIITSQVGERMVDIHCSCDPGTNLPNIVMQGAGSTQGGRYVFTFRWLVDSDILSTNKEVLMLFTETQTYANVTSQFPLPDSVQTTVHSW